MVYSVTTQLHHRNYDRTHSEIGWVGKFKPYVRDEPTSIVFMNKMFQQYCELQEKVAGTNGS